MDSLFATRNGRMLEVREYGDPAGHPAFFFHGLIGSHHQASYIAEQAARQGLRIIAPNRPGVGRSEFVERASALEAVPDVEDIAAALGLDEFSVIGLSGGTPYALACLCRLGPRVRTTTVISGMGPLRLPRALVGMDRERRVALEIGSRFPRLARRGAKRWAERFKADPEAFLKRIVATWPVADRALFEDRRIFELFLLDLRQVFVDGSGPETYAQELKLYRNYGFSLADLPRKSHVTLWQGLHDVIVPPAMAWRMTQILPCCESHFVPGGHFVAITIADQILIRLKKHLHEPASSGSGSRRSAS
jgi:pimeloyl-ACP methyl ester carboxylesterase